MKTITIRLWLGFYENAMPLPMQWWGQRGDYHNRISDHTYPLSHCNIVSTTINVMKYSQNTPEHTISPCITIDSVFPFDHKNFQEKHENDTSALCDCQSHTVTARRFVWQESNMRPFLITYTPCFILLLRQLS